MSDSRVTEEREQTLEWPLLIKITISFSRVTSMSMDVLSGALGMGTRFIARIHLGCGAPSVTFADYISRSYFPDW